MSALLSAGLVAAGVGTATLSGITGIGGGTVLIAVLYAIGLTPAVAVPLHAAVQLVSNGTRTFAYMRDVEWRAAGWFLLAGVPAPFLVAGFVAQANVDVIRLLLAVMILISVVPSRATGPRLSKRGAYLLAGLLTGSLGMFVGATGLFVGRLFLRPDLYHARGRIDRRIRGARQNGLQRFGQLFAQFNAPLVKAVDAQNHAFDEHAVFIKRNNLAQYFRRELRIDQCCRRAITREHTVTRLTLQFVAFNFIRHLAARLVQTAAFHQRLGLGQTVGDQ